MPGAEQLAPLLAGHLMHTDRGLRGVHRGECYRGATRRAVCPVGLMRHDSDSIGRDTLSNAERMESREHQRDPSAGSLADAVGGLVSFVSPGRHNGIVQERCGVLSTCWVVCPGGLRGASAHAFSLMIKRASTTVTLSAPPAAFASSTRR